MQNQRRLAGINFFQSKRKNPKDTVPEAYFSLIAYAYIRMRIRIRIRPVCVCFPYASLMHKENIHIHIRAHTGNFAYGITHTHTYTHTWKIRCGHCIDVFEILMFSIYSIVFIGECSTITRTCSDYIETEGGFLTNNKKTDIVKSKDNFI